MRIVWKLSCALYLILITSGIQAQIAPLHWQWAQGTICRAPVQGAGLAGDSHGNVVVSGYFDQDSIVFGNTTLNSIFPNGNYYLAKYNPAGQVVWAHGITNDFLCGYMYGLKTDAADNIWSIAYMLSDTFASSSFYMLIKHDSMGQIDWKDTVRLARGSVRSLATDQTGSGYLGGDFNDSVRLGNFVLHCPTGNNYGYLAKYKPSGAVAWAKALISDTTANCDVHYTSTSRQGYVYASGFYFAPSMHIDTDTLRMPVPYIFPTTGNMNPLCNYIAKLDTNGHVKWITGASVQPKEYGLLTAIHADENDNLWVAGNYTGDSVLIGNYMLRSPAGQSGGHNFLAKLDTAGKVIWAKYYSVTNNFSAIETDRAGNAYISGICNNYLVLDADTLRAVGMPTLNGTRYGSFVMVVDPNGNNKCAQPFYDGGRYATLIAKDANDNFFFSGNFDSTFVIAGDTLRSGRIPQFSFTSSFVAKFNDCTINGINNITNPVSTLRLSPNPSSGATIVSFTLPEGTTEATLSITDMLGKEIERYPLQNSQMELLVNVHGISIGIYIVSLIAGGRLVAGQKMVVE